MPIRALAFLLPVVILCSALVACSTTANQDAANLTTSELPTSTELPANTELATTAGTDTSAQEEQATTPETTEMPPEEETSQCRSLTDFGSDELNQQWTVVNDDVMGGRSLGGMSFDSDTMIFAGEVNTNGGGFASLRLPLEPEKLSPYDRIEFRARPDGRTYTITFDDDLASRNRRVSHRAPIPFSQPGEWQTVSVAFTDLFPAIFGRPIDDLPFRKDLATRMGLMISDGVDGPFRIEIDWIDLCAGSFEK